MINLLMLGMLLGLGMPLLSNKETSSRHVISFKRGSRNKTITIKLSNENNNAHVITQYNSMEVPVVQTVHQPPAVSLPQQTGLLATLTVWCKDHKSIMAIGTIGVALATLWSYLKYVEYALEHRTGWSSWHAGSSYEQLTTSNQKHLARELFASIKKRYLPSNYTSINFLDPLVAFMKECDAEVAFLSSSQTTIKRLSLLKNTAKLQAMTLACQERIERILYLKKLSITWLSEYDLKDSYTPNIG